MAPLTDKNTNARRYSIEHLLSMRVSLSIVNCVVDKINQHPDIVAIFKLPEKALRQPRSYTCLTETLSNSNQQKRAMNEKRFSEVSEDSGRHSLSKSSIRSFREQTNSWQIRQRPILDPRCTFDNQNQPYSAPTSIISHQSENFRRFYRAVVSPTHVRVTAGGRIVPNNRATAPPTFDPLARKNSSVASKRSDEQQRSDRMTYTDETGGNTQGLRLTDIPSLPPPFPSAFQGPFLPTYNYLPQGNSLALNGTGHTSQSQFHHQANQNVSGGDMTNAQGIKISPPAQFDQSRPYLVYNNQVFFPVPGVPPPPPNGFITHPGMLGPQPFPAPVMPGAPGHFMPPTMLPMPMPMPMPMPIANFAPLMPHANGQPLPMMAHPAHPLPLAQGPFQPILPLPAAHVEQHLQLLRNHLAVLDDHITSQSLQDDAFTSNQRQALTTEIARLTAMLPSQQNHNANSQAAKHPAQTRANSEHSQVDENRQSPVSTVIGSSSGSTNTNGQNHSEYSTFAPQAAKIVDFPAVKNVTPKKAPVSVVGSRLPATAAMAPPFRPRSHPPLTAEQMEIFAVTSPGRSSPPATPESQLEREQRLISRAQTCWEDSAAGTSLVSMPKSQTMHVPHSQHRTRNLPNFQRAETYHSSSIDLKPVINAPNPGTKSAFTSKKNAEPYLRGHPSPEANSDRGEGPIFTYARPLTEAENIARAIYWGTYPRTVSTRNLPKFDGQDFYPASPVKGLLAKESVEFQDHCRNLFGPTPSSSPIRATVSSHALGAAARRGVLKMSSFNDPAIEMENEAIGEEATIDEGISRTRRPLSEPSIVPGGAFSDENIFIEDDALQAVYGSKSADRRQTSDDETSTLRGSVIDPVSKASPKSVGEDKLSISDKSSPHSEALPSRGFSGVFTNSTLNLPAEQAPSEDHSNIFDNGSAAYSASEENLDPNTPARASQDISEYSALLNAAAFDNQGTYRRCSSYANEEMDSVDQWKMPNENGSATIDLSGPKKPSVLAPPTTEDGSPKPRSSFAQRIASTSSTSDQKSQLLQTMLKLHVANHASVAAPAYVSSDNIQGILPAQNRGSAAASLAPAMGNVTVTSGPLKINPRGFDYPVTPENRSRIKYNPLLHRSPESLAAEDYAKYLRGRD